MIYHFRGKVGARGTEEEEEEEEEEQETKTKSVNKEDPETKDSF